MPYHLLRHDHPQEVQITCLEVLVGPSHQRLVCIFWHHVSSPSPWSFFHSPPWSSLYLGPSQPGCQEEKVTINRGRKGVFPVRGTPSRGDHRCDHPKRRCD